MTNEDIRAFAVQFLKQNKTAVVATVSFEGEPRGATVYFVIDDDLTFYFLTGRQTHKFKNLEQNKKLAFVVGTGPAVTTIQCGGEAEFLAYPYANDVIDRLAENLSLKESKHWPIVNLPEGDVVIIKVKPIWMTLVNLDMARPEMYSEKFLDVIPRQ